MESSILYNGLSQLRRVMRIGLKSSNVQGNFYQACDSLCIDCRGVHTHVRVIVKSIWHQHLEACVDSNLLPVVLWSVAVFNRLGII